MTAFRTVTTHTYEEYKEKGSKFIGLVFPVADLPQIKSILTKLRKEYYDARHHCYAYIMGMDPQTYRANDDGEPNHSAGDPILGQIRSRELTNTLVVVVRYFGGTKLGVSGLISAYKIAAGEALSKAKITEIYQKEKFSLVYAYEQTAMVERWIDLFELDVIRRDYTDKCTLIFEVKKDKSPDLQSRMKVENLVFKQMD
jgi:uncharacterized YigZ family protein